MPKPEENSGLGDCVNPVEALEEGRLVAKRPLPRSFLLHLHLSTLQGEKWKVKHEMAVYELRRHVDERKADLIRRVLWGCPIILNSGDHIKTEVFSSRSRGPMFP